MKTIEAICEHDKIIFNKEKPPKGYRRVFITFLEEEKIITTEKAEESFPKVDMKELMKKKSSLEKWFGCLKDVDISDWKEDRIKYLEEKHK